jgi:hypothetical protein
MIESQTNISLYLQQSVVTDIIETLQKITFLISLRIQVSLCADIHSLLHICTVIFTHFFEFCKWLLYSKGTQPSVREHHGALFMTQNALSYV